MALKNPVCLTVRQNCIFLDYRSRPPLVSKACHAAEGWGQEGEASRGLGYQGGQREEERHQLCSQGEVQKCEQGATPL